MTTPETFGQLQPGDSVWQFSPSLNRLVHYTLKDTQIHSGRNYIVLILQTGSRTTQRIVLESAREWGNLRLTQAEAINCARALYQSTLENKASAINSHAQAIKTLESEAADTQKLLDDFNKHAAKAVETLPEEETLKLTTAC